MKKDGRGLAVKFPKVKKKGAIFSSNRCGDFEIIEYRSSKDISIRFLSTGYNRIVKETAKIYSGAIRDPYFPSVYGRGYIGEGKYKSRTGNKHTLEYVKWKGMFERCYNKTYQKKRPTYKGCYVNPCWFDFQNFAKWHHENYPRGEKLYQLDKDIIKDGNREYGPDFCKYVTRDANMEKAFAKHFELRDPDERVVSIYNMTKFCEDKDLSVSAMCRLYKGLIECYKGWTRIINN